eukprot:TRINITY_DN76116_c0_g1_i1.p1 TRINITY_DN76116_c0_g1~~TRINITY_DN76116_c0_g1_i1.p1  ORF type:complete len:243 (+),score=35.26 TRINITY_DN76116_c0_g1_i1:115-843(+)
MTSIMTTYPATTTYEFPWNTSPATPTKLWALGTELQANSVLLASPTKSLYSSASESSPGPSEEGDSDDYSDFDSDDEEEWARHGLALRPNCSNLDNASETDTDYSDFDSEDEASWEAQGWACLPNISTSTAAQGDEEEDYDSDYSDFDSDADEWDLCARGWRAAPGAEGPAMPDFTNDCWQAEPSETAEPEEPKDTSLGDGLVTPHSVREWAKAGITEFRLNVPLLMVKLNWLQNIQETRGE